MRGYLLALYERREGGGERERERERDRERGKEREGEEIKSQLNDSDATCRQNRPGTDRPWGTARLEIILAGANYFNGLSQNSIGKGQVQLPI